VANFVHDIRTPANSLYGFLDILESQITDERLKTYLVNAKESASFINELTTSVLNMISSHKESETTEIQEIDTIQFFSSVAKSFASNMYTKRIKFNIYIDPLLPKSIMIDTLKMKRVILNLIGNAYKFTPNDKTIEFSVRYSIRTKRIAIYVKDTGIGIPKEKQKTIFEAFQQAQDTTALNFGGTGLGLFISAKYVSELGGDLALISEVDKGSTFSFDVPAYIANEAPSYTPIDNYETKVTILMDPNNNFSANNIARYMMRMGINKENIALAQSLSDVKKETTHLVIFQHKLQNTPIDGVIKEGKKVLIVEEEFLSIEKDQLPAECGVISQYGYFANDLYKFLSVTQLPRVLIVDDDNISILLIKTILENEFCELSIAHNGKEAFEMFVEAHQMLQPFSILYADNNMPVMNGSEMIRQIREYENDNKLDAVFAVSTSGDELSSQDEQPPFDRFIGKPFKKEDIAQALQYVTH
jgi:CheY-like chemotaxis protein